MPKPSEILCLWCGTEHYLSQRAMRDILIEFQAGNMQHMTAEGLISLCLLEGAKRVRYSQSRSYAG